MRINYSSSLLFACLLLVVVSCSWFEKDIEVKEELSFQLDRSENASPEFVATLNQDMQNADIEKHKDDIKKSTISKVTFTVTDYTGQGTPELSALLTFAAQGTTNTQTLGTFSNAELAALAQTGEEVLVTLGDEAAKEALKSMILGGDKVTFTLQGTTGTTPVRATINVTIYFNLTVGI